MVEDCGATTHELSALRAEMRVEAREIRQDIDKIKANRYAPFLGAMGLFVLIWAGLWTSLRNVENEIDAIHVQIALVVHQANEYRNNRMAELERHQREHRRERERFNGLVEFVARETGITVKIEEPEE